MASGHPELTRIRPAGNITILEDGSLTLTCSASCRPGCNYKWVKDGRDVAFGDTLIISPVRRRDEGVYECVSDNGIPPSGSKTVAIRVNCEFCSLFCFLP